ncbi:MAG: HlyD family efflux transporter periplasmic adaptor subunit [Clostridia bacterium]|nr:HlyD family efflux transporter periplasmic adaptor subunit [Clostridia bacterium]
MFKKLNASYWLLGITALAVAALLIWPTAALSALPLERSLSVSIGRALQGSIEKTIALAGTLAYGDERYAIAQQSGIAAWVTSKQEGQQVAAGEALLRLDTTAQETLLAQAYATQQPEQLKSLLNLDQAQQAAQLEAAIQQSTVRAYQSGQVLQVLVRPGEMVQAGAPVALMASHTQQIKASVGAQERRKLREGMAVRLEQEGKFLAWGRIDSLGTMSMDAATGLSSAQVTITPASPLSLTLGDQVEVVAILAEAHGVITVPLSALDAQGQVWQVYEGRAWPTQGRVVLWDDVNAWVEGLAEDDAVILAPPANLRSGQRVKEAKGI